jgi:predicted metalloenzyme YecM
MSKEEFDKFLCYVDKISNQIEVSINTKISNQIEVSINTAKTKEEWREYYSKKGYKVIKTKQR